MVSFFTLVPLLFSVSLNSTNELYPSYQYSVHIESESYIPSLSYQVRNIIGTIQYYTWQSTLSLHVEGDLYFNSDNTQWYIPSLQGTLDVGFYYYDGVNDQYIEESTYSLDIFDYNISGNSGFSPVESYQLRVNNYVYNVYEVDPISQTDTFLGSNAINELGYQFLSGQNPSAFRIDASDFVPNIRNIINGFVENGYTQGFDNGYNSGYGVGLEEGYDNGASSGYQQGYSDGYQEASDQDSTAVTIFTGICEVGLLPVNVFLGILNFEVFGINIGGFVASLMTIAIVVIVLRVILGAKSKDD